MSSHSSSIVRALAIALVMLAVSAHAQADLVDLLNGVTNGPTQPVPEPTGAVAIAAAGLALLLRR
ncbi:MAG: hypothetical protein ACOYMN_26560, partial [Roseimicrobium sp.]